MKTFAIILAIDGHRNSPVISLSFERDYDLIRKIKTLESVNWNLSRKFWHISQNHFKLSEVFEKLSAFAFMDYSALKSQKQERNAAKNPKPKEIKIELSETARKTLESFKLWMQSNAKYLLETGVDLRYIQGLLGHNSSKTTEIYPHIARTALAKIKSPLDHFIDSKANNINKIQK